MKSVVVLAEAAEDIEQARDFYDAQTRDIGEYCADSLVADIESLALYHGIHARHFGFYRMLAHPVSVWNLLPRNRNGNSSHRRS